MFRLAYPENIILLVRIYISGIVSASLGRMSGQSKVLKDYRDYKGYRVCRVKWEPWVPPVPKEWLVPKE
jgi:hypothetical protein